MKPERHCHTQNVKKNTVTIDSESVILSSLTADPALAEGKLWFRSDRDLLRYSPNGVKAREFPSNVYAIISCRVGASVTGDVYAPINNSDMLLNISDFPADAKAILRVVWTNDTATETNYIELYDQLGGAPVANSEVSEVIDVGGTYEISENASSFTLPTGLKSFQIRAKVSGGTMTISKIELQIEKG